MAMPDFRGAFTYDPNTGHLFWSMSNIYNKQKGQRAGCVNSRGYRILTFKKKSYLEHRVIAEMFIPKIEGKDQINHKNGVKDDNRLENLEWCTGSENCQHSVDTGLMKVKSLEENPNSKLTKEQVLFCIENYKPRDSEFGARALSRKFGVDKSTISLIINGTNWKGVKYEHARSAKPD